jgi:hypothetical protein
LVWCDLKEVRLTQEITEAGTKIKDSCGYEQLNNGHLQEAVSIFQADIHLHPNPWNAYDSVWEAT